MMDFRGRPVPEATRRVISRSCDLVNSLEMGMRAKRQLYSSVCQLAGDPKGIEAARLEVISAMEVLLDAEAERFRIVHSACYPNG